MLPQQQIQRAWGALDASDDDIEDIYIMEDSLMSFASRSRDHKLMQCNPTDSLPAQWSTLALQINLNSDPKKSLTHLSGYY